MSKDAYYFSHDSNSRNDLKMVKLRRLAGMEGIGVFWCVIEMLREADNYELPTDTIEDICYDLRVETETFDILFSVELLDQKEDVFYSKSLKNRMQKLDKIKQIRSEAGSKGGRPKSKTKPKENQLLNKSKTNETNKSKVNKSKVNKYRDNVSMSEDEFNKLIDKYGKSLTEKYLDKLDNYKAANGKRYRSDYRAILSWVVDSIPKDKITTSIYPDTN